MKKLIGVVATLICVVVPPAEAQELVYNWAGRMGSTGHDEGRGIAVGGSGNVCTVGIFEASGDFDPGPNASTLVSAGGKDVFISKLTSTGDLAWAKRIGGTNDDYGNAIAVDDSGYVYITGYFAGSVDFDPGDSVRTLSSSGIAYDVFILKLDTAGNYKWAERIGSASPDQGYGITVDPFGDVYVTGGNSDICDMDPGAGTQLLDPGAFVLKLDRYGVFQWAGQLGAFGDVGTAVRTDGSGNVYITGGFGGTSDFDPGAGSYPLTGAGDVDIFVVKLDASDAFVWARNMGGTNTDQANAIAVDTLENVYLTGGFRGTCDFDPSATSFELTAVNAWDAFTMKLDADGAFVWAFAIGGTTFGSSDVGFGIEVDDAGTVYTTGNFLGNVDFDPGPASSFLNSGSTTNIFVHVVSTDGAFLWVGQVGGGSLNYNTGKAIALGAGAVHVTGSFVSTNIDFDTGADAHPLSSAGGYDVFVLKLDEDLSTHVASAAVAVQHAVIFPNPAMDRIWLDVGSMDLTSVALFDAAGRPVLQQVSTGSSRVVLTVGDLPGGAYTLITRSKNGEASSYPVLIAR